VSARADDQREPCGEMAALDPAFLHAGLEAVEGGQAP